jgi:hypothetical protein
MEFEAGGVIFARRATIEASDWTFAIFRHRRPQSDRRHDQLAWLFD